jgi:hypothetical protein
MDKSNIEHIIFGLKRLYDSSHLVKQQIVENVSLYEKNFDNSKFINKIGNINKFVASGVFGCVFDLSNNKILKITLDRHEAPFLQKYCIDNKTPGFVSIDRIYEDVFGTSKIYYIIREQIHQITDKIKIQQVIDDYKSGDRNIKYDNDIKNGISFALQAMYNIDNNWRGTHINNLAYQNEKIVLYDGFSKNAPISTAIEKY